MRVFSGGQTGVDRAALDAARQVGLRIGGWCPRGGRSEDKINLPEVYPELRETPERNYKQRTEWNVRDASATLILYLGETTPGTALTLRLARNSNKPWLLVDLRKDNAKKEIEEFLEKASPEILNVAGPRESGFPGIYKRARSILAEAFEDNF